MASRRRPAQPTPTVEAFLQALEHPLRADIACVRRWILAVSPAVTEAIKWNAPSFRTTDFFATFHLRSREAVQLVLHTGAKPKASSRDGLALAVPAGLDLRWLAKDRALLTLGAGARLRRRRAAVTSLLARWVEALH